jgi:DNA-binding response OmpR family regulator
VARAVRARGARGVILLSTGAERANGATAAADYVFTRPFSPLMLMNAVAELLARPPMIERRRGQRAGSRVRASSDEAAHDRRRPVPVPA